MRRPLRCCGWVPVLDALGLARGLFCYSCPVCNRASSWHANVDSAVEEWDYLVSVERDLFLQAIADLEAIL